MLISEFADPDDTDDTESTKLLGLIEFLNGQADNQASRKQISKETFLSLASGLGININKNNLDDLLAVEPLSNVLEPLDPARPDEITFKGGGTGPKQMPVRSAQDIVAASAKSAMKRNMP